MSAATGRVLAVCAERIKQSAIYAFRLRYVCGYASERHPFAMPQLPWVDPFVSAVRSDCHPGWMLLLIRSRAGTSNGRRTPHYSEIGRASRHNFTSKRSLCSMCTPAVGALRREVQSPQSLSGLPEHAAACRKDDMLRSVLSCSSLLVHDVCRGQRKAGEHLCQLVYQTRGVMEDGESVKKKHRKTPSMQLSLEWLRSQGGLPTL